jgi:hypothetical protein
MSDRFGVGQVVHADNSDVVPFQSQACDFAADSSKTIDPDFDSLRHGLAILLPLVRFNDPLTIHG